MLQRRLANCAVTVGKRLIVRDTVAVDTLARFAISRMSIAVYSTEVRHCNWGTVSLRIQNSICVSLEEPAFAKLHRAPIHRPASRHCCSQKIFGYMAIDKFAGIDGRRSGLQTIPRHSLCSAAGASRTHEKRVGGKCVPINCGLQFSVIDVVIEYGIPTAA